MGRLGGRGVGEKSKINKRHDDILKNPHFRKILFCHFRDINKDFGKILKMISQRVLVKLQTGTVFAQSLSNSYD